jgi:DNA primase
VYLPEDFELLVPFTAKIWLRKYGVTDAEIKKYRFGYSERMNRLILPVFNGEELVYWQGRSLAPSKFAPKYLSMKSNSGSQFFDLCKKGSKDVVLVEDIISAIVLRRAGYNAIALLGSYIGEKITSYLHKSKIKRVCIWLDPDKRKDAVAFAKRLRGIGFDATCLVTPTKDPKDYNVTQVRAHLTKGGFTYVLEESKDG